MAQRNPGVCEVCERRVRKRKDNPGLRVMHSINETGWFGYTLKPCRGATPQGARPSARTIAEGKKTKIRCLCCEQDVPRRGDFRPRKHTDPKSGRDCRGWSDNTS